MSTPEPFHEGELAVQRRTGESAKARMNAAAFADRIPGGALAFIGHQPMAVLGSIGAAGDVWASVLFGPPGFLSARDDRTLELDVSSPRSATDDPLWANLASAASVGLLVMDPGSRRRLRVNGRIRRVAEERFVLNVERAYPNCPKYIQRRHWTAPATGSAPPTAPGGRGTALTRTQQTLIAHADTFFVASAHHAQGVDASHRGGRPGFVRVLDERRLLVPDYAGNSLFNTLGNLSVYPRAGLAFIDFRRGRVLQLSGRTEVLWDCAELDRDPGTTGRCWRFEVQAWLETAVTHALAWEPLDFSPFLRATGPCGDPDPYALELRVERVERETERIRSFRLASVDRRPLPPFAAGAHLPLQLPLPDGTRAERQYSLLSDPRDRLHYRIAVLAQPRGRGASMYLHEGVKEGTVLRAARPRNTFPIADGASHSILIAGGIGITPILCMLRALAATEQSFELHYSARLESDLAFREEIEALAGERAHFYATRDRARRRLHLEALLSTPRPGTHAYVCGPRGLIAAAREHALAHGWPAERVHVESFGATPSEGDRGLRVLLARSGRTVHVPAQGSILESLLEAGIAVAHDCKRGECALCVTRVLAGEPEHRDLCLSAEERAGSMCVCVSRALGDGLTLDL